MQFASIFSRPPRVLVADDDWLNRDLLQAYLGDTGCEVTTVSDGAQALERARAEPPDLILLDVQMPRMTGLEVCRALKADPATQFIPIIIVTALDADEDKLRAIESGADEFISKPFNSLMLLTRVRSLLRVKRLHDELDSRNKLLRQVLNKYVAEEVADTVLTDPERYLRLGGETRYVTVLFADIRGFTQFTERHTAESVVDALNRIFHSLTQLVFKHQGTFDKYLGDAVMAFYGAPIGGPDDAQRAVETALEMQSTFGRLRAQETERLAGLGLGIGLHSGEATVGNIGSEQVMDYTVIGDTVNVAKRLQENAGPGQILVSEATFRLVHGVPAVRLEEQILPGRREPVSVYSLRVPG